MHFHGPIIRPQTDADSLFIEVTAGCSHNSCTFCNFYKDTPFPHRAAGTDRAGPSGSEEKMAECEENLGCRGRSSMTR